jgi:hypothetical protein
VTWSMRTYARTSAPSLCSRTMPGLLFSWTTQTVDPTSIQSHLPLSRPTRPGTNTGCILRYLCRQSVCLGQDHNVNPLINQRKLLMHRLDQKLLPSDKTDGPFWEETVSRSRNSTSYYFTAMSTENRELSLSTSTKHSREST